MKHAFFALKYIVRSIIFPILLVSFIFTLIDFTTGILIYNSNISSTLYKTQYDRSYFNILESFNKSSVFIFLVSISFALCLQKTFAFCNKKRFQINIQKQICNTKTFSNRARNYNQIIVPLRI